MLISPHVLVVMWQTQITSFSAQKEQGVDNFLITTSGNTLCFVEQKGCRTAERVDTQSKNKGPYSFWTNYKMYSSDALKIRNLERRTVKKLQMWDLKYKDRISPSQKPLC